MGHGYSWTEALHTSGAFALFMFCCSLALLILAYTKQRRTGGDVIALAVLAFGLLACSVSMFYQGTYSEVRMTLDRIDDQIMRAVDRSDRINALIKASALGSQGCRAQLLQASKKYIGDFEKSVVAAMELDFLKDKFNVPESGRPSTLRVVLHFAGIFGQLTAVIIILMASIYLGVNYGPGKKMVLDIGPVATGLIILCAWIYAGKAMVFMLVPCLLAALLLHYSSKRKTERPLKLAGFILLAFSIGLYAVSAWAMVESGKAEIGRNLFEIEQRLPGIKNAAQSLGLQVDQVVESEGAEEKHVSGYQLDINVGALEEQLQDANDRDFDPYRDDREQFYSDLASGKIVKGCLVK